jgi:hypothetical protein
VEAQPAQSGRWDTLPFDMPINPVHVALMHTGKVLVISGSASRRPPFSIPSPKRSKIRRRCYYLLFILNGKGVPSEARFVQLKAPLAKKKKWAPTAAVH